MTPGDLQALLRLKQAREQRAIAALAQARAAEREAAAAREAARRAVALYATRRRAVEAEIYDGLLAAGPVAVRGLQAAAARLAQEGALGEALAGRGRTLDRALQERAEATQHAQASQLRAARGAQAWDQLAKRAGAGEAVQAAQRQEAELDEVAARRASATSGGVS